MVDRRNGRSRNTPGAGSWVPVRLVEGVAGGGQSHLGGREMLSITDVHCL